MRRQHMQKKIIVSLQISSCGNCAAFWIGGNVKGKKRLNEESRKAYVEGMKKYQEQGVHVLIDGKEVDDSQWDKIFEVREDGSFYMGDYILEDAPQTGGQPSEPCAEHGVRRRLKEIRFDIVYNR